MSLSTPPQSGRSVAVGVFERASEARSVVEALAERGTPQSQVGLIDPGEGDGSALQEARSGVTDVDGLLASKGVPAGETRFYAEEVRSGRALLVVDAARDYDAVRELILQHGGYDVQSRGAELARGHVGRRRPGPQHPAARLNRAWL